MVKKANKQAEDATPKMSLKERMAQKAGKTADDPKKASKKDRARLALTPEEKTKCERWAVFQQLAKKAEAKADDIVVRALIRKKVLGDWVTLGRKADNPSVQTDKCKFNCVSKDMTKSGQVKVPPTSDGARQPFTEYLSSQHLPQSLIEAVQGLVIEEELQSVTSPDEIEKKNPELANKIRELLLEGLTDAEFDEVVKNINKVSFKPGFVDAAAAACQKISETDDEDAEEQALKSLEKVLSLTGAVQHQLSHVNYLDDLSPAIQELLAPEEVEKDVEMEVPGGDWKLLISKNCVKLFDKDGKEIGTKECTDRGHAMNSAKKMMKNREYLEETKKEMVG